MDHKLLNDMIAELEFSIPAISGFLSSLTVQDWRPLFAKARDIQAAFNSGIRYPSKQDRDAAWTRFNNARNLLFERANAERARFREESESLRDGILSYMKNAGYNALDEIAGTFLLDPVDAEEMKAKAQTLREAGQMLSENKHRMLKEHKDECFERIQALRREHDAFWGRYKSLSAAKRAESARKLEEMLIGFAGIFSITVRSLGKRLLPTNGCRLIWK